jgi:hypothetical protein
MLDIDLLLKLQRTLKFIVYADFLLDYSKKFLSFVVPQQSVLPDPLTSFPKIVE